MNGQVISVSGPPGAGKTALSEQLALGLGAQVVSYDDFELMTRQPVAKTLDWLRRGAPYDEVETPGLAEALATARAKGVVVFDTPLGRAHPETGGAIDIALWIECPLDVALARKIRQLSEHVPSAQSAQFVEWLSAYLGHYEAIIRPACQIQKNRVGDTSDMVVQATTELAEIVKKVKADLPRAFFE